MCDSRLTGRLGWKGWCRLPPATPLVGQGPWQDLTHPLTEHLSRAPAFPAPVIRKFMQMPDKPANVTELQMVVHYGTHLDAPLHFFNDAPGMEDISLDRLMGPGVCWRFDLDDHDVIGVADLARATPQVQPGDIVILDTGWARHMGTERYDRHPSLAAEAAHWLVERQIKLLAVDNHTPDLATSRRPAGFTWPVHDALLSRGILIAEHLTNLDTLANSRIEALFMALPIDGSDGAPARVLARRVR